MTQIPNTRGNPQASEIAVQDALSFNGGLSREDLQTVLDTTDADMARLYEDRNIFLANGGSITFTGTTITFTENLELHINSQVAGGSPTIVSLGSTTRTVDNDGDMVYAVVDRGAGTATVTDDATTLPTVTSANKEVFLIAKRIDDGGASPRLYLANGNVLANGQSAAIGEIGAGSTGVTASSTFGLNEAVIVADGTSRAVKASNVVIDGFDNMSGIGTLTTTSDLNIASNTLYVDASNGAGIHTVPDSALQFHVSNDGTATTQSRASVANGDSTAYLTIVSPGSTTDSAFVVSTGDDFRFAHSDNIEGTSNFDVKMRLTASGSLGVGADPDSKFHLADSGTVISKIESTNGSIPRLEFIRNGGSSTFAADASGDYAIENNNGDLDFISGSTVLGTNTRMSILATGEVGIGTASPSTNLHIDEGTGTDCYITLEMGTGNSGSNESGIDYKNSSGTTIFSNYFTNNGGNFVIESDLTSNAFVMARSGGDITLAGDLEISKATPRFTLDASSGSCGVVIDSASGQDPFLLFEEAGVSKWILGMDASNFDRFSISQSGSLGSTERFSIGGTGNVGIGDFSSDTQDNPLHIFGTAASMKIERTLTSGTVTNVVFEDGDSDINGTITCNLTANTTAYNTSSDARLKTNHRDYNALNIIDQINPTVYERITQPGVDEYGLTAQDLMPLVPQAVIEGGDDARKDPWMVDYSKLTSIAIKGIKELKEDVVDLESRIEALEA